MPRVSRSDDPRLDQLLEVMADRALGEAQQRLDLTHADGLTVGPQEQVDDLQPVPIGERLEHGLQLRRPLVVEGRSGERGAAVDHGEVTHRAAKLTDSSMNLNEVGLRP